MNVLQKILRLHWLSFVVMLGMGIAGYYFIKSATQMSDMPELIVAPRQQLLWLMIGLFVYFTLALINYEFVLRCAPVIYGGMVCILIFVLLAGTEVNGAKSWIRFAGVSIQPAEFSKIAYIIGLSWFLLQFQEHIKEFWVICVVIVSMLIPVGLILKQPDLGSAAVFLPITFIMLYVAGVRKRYLCIPVIGALLLCWLAFFVIYKAKWDGTLQDTLRGLRDGIVWTVPGNHFAAQETLEATSVAPIKKAKASPKLDAVLSLEKVENKKVIILKPYQLDRIRTFFNPNLDPLGSGWTIRQSLIAVGSGGFKGKGYLKGDQNIYGFLPKNIAYNDFIFSVIAEEWGFVGGSILIAAQGLLILCLVTIASRAKEMGGALLAAGMTGMLFTHFFVNVGMTIKVVPITGIPLPFISYGGTFLVACMAGLGILQSVWIHKKAY
ncbi:MAG: rod shape-determining protein RodA [Blastochloris sp.]|jgi:rod shape determining protein RodA|nr:rod shape-determining protein RodA [Blastochloris sp.]